MYSVITEAILTVFDVLMVKTLSSTTFYCHGIVPKSIFVKFMLERKYIDIWISRSTFWPRPIRPWAKRLQWQKKLEFILDVIRKLTSRKLKVQTYYTISDLLVNELRKRRAVYSDFYEKLEVFLRLQTCQVLK